MSQNGKLHWSFDYNHAGQRPYFAEQLVETLQEYYEKNGIAPMVRVLSKVTGFKLKHIYELFPSGPGKGACKMAGLPKPTGCV